MDSACDRGTVVGCQKNDLCHIALDVLLNEHMLAECKQSERFRDKGCRDDHKYAADKLQRTMHDKLQARAFFRRAASNCGMTEVGEAAKGFP